MGNLPRYHHKADREFIKTSVSKLPVHWRKQVIDVYSDKYKETLCSEPNENMRENRARKFANAWLRGYVKKYQERYLQKPANNG